MNWLDKLDKKIGKYAIPNLMTYIVIFNAVVYVLNYIVPGGLLVSKLTLIPELVLQGEVWRIVTFILIPPGSSPIWIFFALYFYYMVGNGLEQEWGSFRFNIYYLFGMIATVAASFITSMPMTATYLNLSLFLAFARIYPDFEILLFFFLPMKVKYLGWFNWAVIAYTIVLMPMADKVASAASVVNFFIFFGREMLGHTQNRKKVYNNRKKFTSKVIDNVAFHRCTVCGITEKDDPKMEFRYCSQCDGDHEYCMVHLKNHEHIKNNKE